uniref:Transmembrane protein 110, like n=1 Tax=Cynoglossus semilaevis TaxID=244447 RepID=A0A3P8X108_CYNSE
MVLGVNEVTNMSELQEAEPRGCEDGALTDRFGVLIQALLAVVAFSTLMLKRFREPAGIRRPWRIWFYDTSKQAIGALFVHFANVLLSTLTKQDPCSLYLINFLLDATLGMLLIWIAVKLVSKLVERKQWTLLVFGEYGDPPAAAAWLGQCGVYLLIMVLEKSAVSLVLLVPGWSKLQAVMLSYMANPQLELVLVMLIVPFIVNAVMFWVVDSLTMRKYKNLKSPEEPFIGSEKKRKKDDDDDVSLLNDENHHGVRQRHLLVKTIIPCLLGLLVLSTENCH